MTKNYELPLPIKGKYGKRFDELSELELMLLMYELSSAFKDDSDHGLVMNTIVQMTMIISALEAKGYDAEARSWLYQRINELTAKWGYLE